MAKDVEKVRPGLIREINDGDGDHTAFVVPYHGAIGSPDFTAIRPPETGGRVQDAWARNPIVLVLRAKWRGQLWLTEFWWRSAILLALLGALVLLFIIG